MARRLSGTGKEYENQTRERPWRLYVVGALLAAYTLVVVGKLGYVQVLQHDYYRGLATEEHWQQSTILPLRGSILAADGAPLATSVNYETLYADARHLSDPNSAATALAPVLGESVASLTAKLANAGDDPLVLKRNMDGAAADRVRALHLLNVYFEPEPQRLHPEGALASQLLGFVGADNNGLAGLEMGWQQELGGTPGSLRAEVDTSGAEIALGLRSYQPPVAGADIVTTIDRFTQRLVERELDKAMKEHEAEGATIIVMDPKTGAILGMASRPSFAVDDPDLFAPGKESLYAFPAVSNVYEPGSVFKVVTMSAGIDSGAVAPDETYVDQGYVVENGVTISNWNGQGYGVQTMAQILQRSLNTGSSYVARKLGPARFYDYVRAFGFGAPTGVDLPGEAVGIVRPQTTAGWSSTDLLTNSFGQGIAVTPLQMVRAIAVVANEGRLMKPQIVREIRSAEGSRRIAPEVERQVIKPETARILTDMLVNAVDKSVVGLAKIDGYRIAGKSGTAEILVDGHYSKEDTVASQVGFAPADDPRFVVLVAITRPKDNIWGEGTASPIFRTVMQELLTHAGIAPQVVAR